MASKAIKDGLLVWDTCRGRNDTDNPEEVADDMAVEALNVTFLDGSLCQKRRGSAAQSLSGLFSGFNALQRFVPGQNDALTELHFLDRSGNVKYWKVAAGTTAIEITFAGSEFYSANNTVACNTSFAALNGKLYQATRTESGGGPGSEINRLHVYDPGKSTTTMRPVGLPLPAAATVANTGSGSYEAIPRYYRIRWLYVSGSIVKLLSNAGAAVAFTPSGSGTAARVTKPTSPATGEAATHWRVEGSPDDTEYFILSAPIVLATTTYDDSVAPPNYSDPGVYPIGTAAPEVGAWTPPPSAKFIISTGDRLLMFGCFEGPSTAGSVGAMYPYNGRVWYTPVIGTNIDGADDDERISNTLTNRGYLDLGRDANAEDRAIVGPMDGQIFVWQSRGMWMLVGSGIATSPYRRIPINPTVGAVSHWSSFVGQDEAGRPCVYFLDPETGPMRYGAGGLQWCGYDIQALWATVNLSASTRVAHGLYDIVSRKCIWWIATGSSNEPDTMIVFHTRLGVPTSNEGVRKGWAKWTGDVAGARCSTLAPLTFGATMSRRLKPYAGFASALLRVEDASSTNDNGTNFQAYVLSKALRDGPLTIFKMVGRAYLKALAASGVTIQQSLIPNFGAESTRTDTVSLTAAGSETRVLRRFEGAALNKAATFQVQIGDSAAASNNWLIDKWMSTVERTAEEK